MTPTSMPETVTAGTDILALITINAGYRVQEYLAREDSDEFEWTDGETGYGTSYAVIARFLWVVRGR